MRISSSRLRAALAGFLAVPLLAACGGDDEEAVQRCIDEARNAAEAAVVADYYEDGKLGPKGEIRRQLNLDGRTYFDSQGHMLPYENLSSTERTFLVLWFTNDNHVDSLTYDARQNALDQLDPDC